VTSTTKAFGENLRRIRRKKGFSQEGLALDAQLNRSYLGSVERGERNISLINIVRLAKTLGVTAAELVRGLEKTLDEE
jgi:transcriptional regulator with XRE-family HTH domain